MHIENLGEITILRSTRKTLSASIGKDGQIVVRAPRALSEKEIQIFLKKYAGRLIRMRDSHNSAAAAASDAGILSEDELNAIFKAAHDYIPLRTAAFAKRMGISYGKISIRCQKTKWGSCSSEHNLNFNCLLMLCPKEIIDYVIVHELCHIIELNHSPCFWTQVERVIPDYKLRRKWLKDNGGIIMKRAGR